MEGMSQSGCTGSKRALLTPKVIKKNVCQIVSTQHSMEALYKDKLGHKTVRLCC